MLYINVWQTLKIGIRSQEPLSLLLAKYVYNNVLVFGIHDPYCVERR